MPRPTKPWNVDPLPPVSPADDRPAVCDLLEQHSNDIASVRTIVSVDNQLYNAAYHDDLWLLRFLLSNKTPSKAATAARNTMAYRSKHGLDTQEQLGWIEPPTLGEEMPNVFKPITDRTEEGTVFHTQPHDDRGVIVYVRMAGLDMTRMVQEVAKEDIRASIRVTNEFYFRVLDEVTRRTGRLTKLVRLVDMEGMTLKRMDRKFLKREGKVAKEIEDFYPQLLASVSVVNVPGWFAALWKIIQLFFPARFKEKLDFVAIPADGKLPKDARIFQHISTSCFPKKYGGESTNWPPEGSYGPPDGQEFVGGLQTYHSLDIERLVAL